MSDLAIPASRWPDLLAKGRIEVLEEPDFAPDLATNLAAIASAWPQFKTQEQAEMYASDLHVVDQRRLALAISRLVKVKVFLPTIAEIRAELRYISNEKAGVLPPPELPMSEEEKDEARRMQRKVMEEYWAKRERNHDG